MYSYTLRVCLLLVDYINTTFSTVSSTAYKNGAQIRKKCRKLQTISCSRISNMSNSHFLCKVYYKLYCLNLLSKPENGNVYHNTRIFYWIELHLFIIVTDMKCNAADNVVLATLIYNRISFLLSVLSTCVRILTKFCICIGKIYAGIVTHQLAQLYNKSYVL